MPKKEKIDVPNWLKISVDHIDGHQRGLDLFSLRDSLDAFGQANGYSRSEIATALNPRWMSETYPGMEDDIAKDLHRSEFWKRFGEFYETEEYSDGELDRAIAESYSDSTVHAITLREGMNRASTLMLWRIRKTGLYKLLSGEYESVREWLLAKLDIGDVSDGERSNILYILEEFLPALDSVGFDSENLLLLPEKWTAARAAVPHLRRITQLYQSEMKMKEAELDKTEKAKERKKVQQEIDSLSTDFTEEIHHTFDVIESTGYRDVPAALKGESKAPKPQKIDGQLIEMPDGTFWLIIPCPNKHYLRMFQKLVRSFIKGWEWRGPMAVVQTVSDMLLNKDKPNE